jgi:hypothetical protein
MSIKEFLKGFFNPNATLPSLSLLSRPFVPDTSVAKFCPRNAATYNFSTSH